MIAGKGRLVFFLVLLGIWILLIGGRLLQVQVVDHSRYVERASQQQQGEIALDPARGTLFDFRGRHLALSVPVDSVYAVPRQIEDPEVTAAALAKVLDVDMPTLSRRLDGEKSFAWIQRKLDPVDAEAVRALGLEGIGFVEESKRYYPQGELAAQVLGYVGTDDDGLSGIERLYDDVVTGRSGQQTVLMDAKRRRVMSPGLAFRGAEPGRDLYLTIDASIQYIVERELARTVIETGAKNGSVVVLDPHSGAVLAMATYPTYDANDFPLHRDRWRNRPVSDFYEPGSTFKVFTAAAALESGVIDETDVLDCGRGSIRIGKTLIRDHHSYDQLTFPQVLHKSSNVGIIRVGLRVGALRLYEMVQAFGFGQRTGIDLPGESAGVVRDGARWTDAALAYASFGQSVAVTPLQLATGFAAVANGGELVQPHILSAASGQRRLARTRVVRGRPISKDTAERLIAILEGVVTDGTAKAARVPGYRVAGKTGTAQKAQPSGGYYADRHFAAFTGFAPSRNAAFVASIAIDEPRIGPYDGGKVAAPLFGRIAPEILRYLGVPPDIEMPETRLARREVPPSIAELMMPVGGAG